MHSTMMTRKRAAAIVLVSSDDESLGDRESGARWIRTASRTSKRETMPASSSRKRAAAGLPAPGSAALLGGLDAGVASSSGSASGSSSNVTGNIRGGSSRGGRRSPSSPSDRATAGRPATRQVVRRQVSADAGDDNEVADPPRRRLPFGKSPLRSSPRRAAPSRAESRSAANPPAATARARPSSRSQRRPPSPSLELASPGFVVTSVRRAPSRASRASSSLSDVSDSSGGVARTVSPAGRRAAALAAGGRAARSLIVLDDVEGDDYSSDDGSDRTRDEYTTTEDSASDANSDDSEIEAVGWSDMASSSSSSRPGSRASSYTIASFQSDEVLARQLQQQEQIRLHQEQQLRRQQYFAPLAPAHVLPLGMVGGGAAGDPWHGAASNAHGGPAAADYAWAVGHFAGGGVYVLPRADHVHGRWHDYADVDNMSYEELLALQDSIGTVKPKSTGLSAAQFENLPAAAYRKPRKRAAAGAAAAAAAQERNECPICLVDYLIGEAVCTLPLCQHQFHRECLRPWFKDHTSCPICRQACEAPPPPTTKAAAGGKARPRSTRNAPVNM